jgi:16S rRNA (cytosine967-C5)-methyltransferase
MTATASSSRAVAVEALRRVDEHGAYANLVVPALLGAADHDLDERDRRFVTELVYGTVRMQRACDWLCDRFLTRDIEPAVRAALRVGAYQLAFLRTPAHAAVDATVEVAPRRARGLVNAVLRRVAAALPEDDDDWPSVGIRLSYPDWIVERLVADLGAPAGLGALAAMNESAEVTVRDDGYVQDRASQWVAAYVEAGVGQRVIDLCAAPGGKSTALAEAGGEVVALDRRPARAGLVVANAARLGLRVATVVADARRPPVRTASFDRVLLDAPCTGLGALRRRPDARWRIDVEAVDRLAALQRELVDAAVALLAPGGRLVYSVCTLTDAESSAIAAHVARTHPGLVPAPAPGPPWSPLGTGGRVLPQDEGTDGMAVFAWTDARRR